MFEYIVKVKVLVVQWTLHIILVSEPKFRRFYKIILNFFVNDFEIVYDMHCICI